MNFFRRVKAQGSLDSCDASIGTANNKLSHLWTKIMNTLYEPPNDIIPAMDARIAVNPYKTKRVFTDCGDTMQNDRHKSIHKRGLVFQARYVPVANNFGYTGIFEKGCDGIARFSYAVRPSINNSTVSILYGFAMKCLLDNQPSVNFFAMHSLNAQHTYNLFERNYSNNLPQPTSTALKIGAQTFRMAKYLAQNNWFASSKDTDPNWLSLDPMAKVLNGDKEYKAPHSIVCVASEDIKSVYSSTGQDIDTTDFRNILNQKGKDTKVFDIYAENVAANSKIGEIYAISDFVASTFGDQQLFFQHPL